MSARGRLHVKKDSWHYKAYQAWWQRKLRWFPDRQPRKQLDLCHYCRVVFLWGPIRWYFQGYTGKWDWIKPFFLTVIAIGAGSAIYFTATNPVVVMVGLLIVAAVIVVAAVTVFTLHYLIRERQAHVTIRQSVVHSTNRTKDSLIVQYVKAKKHRVCPLIEVEQEQTEEDKRHLKVV